jgi:hypothetical protein
LTRVISRKDTDIDEADSISMLPVRKNVEYPCSQNNLKSGANPLVLGPSLCEKITISDEQTTCYSALESEATRQSVRGQADVNKFQSSSHEHT